jgi:sec-independent protein translocase protein TatA
MQTVLLFLGGLGGWEVFLIIAVLVLLFGAKKIPELARGMGRGLREFKDATKEIKDEINYNGDDERERKHKPSATTHADQANTGSAQTEKTAS